MRTLLLIGFFACLYLHFQEKDAEVQQLDSLSTKLSASSKLTSPAKMPSAVTHIQSEHIETEELTAEEIQAVELNGSETYDEDDLSQLPWDDIEEGWKTHLKDFLVSVEPEKAEEMFAAYLEEKKKYVERVDFSESETGVAQVSPASVSEPVVESEGKEGELERIHNENLKDIFGGHHSQVEALHKEYVESVQYLNRSSVKFSISL